MTLTLPIRLDLASPPNETLHVTASGRPVRIYATDGGDDRPIHGAIYIDGTWKPRSWLADGRYDRSEPGGLDLRDRAPVKRGVWVAWFEDEHCNGFFRACNTKDEAQNAKHKGTTLRGVTYLAEGDGLDTPAVPPLWVDWAKLPDWAKWAAVSATGVGRYFAERPERGDGTWMTGSKSGTLAAHFYRVAPGLDWHETRTPRPEGV